MNIIIVGTYPPPLGGVSVHIKRLYNFLKRKGENVVICYDNILKEEQINKDMLPFKINCNLLRKFAAADLVHFHNVGAKGLIIYTLMLRLTNKRVLLTIHNQEVLLDLEYNKKNQVKKVLLTLQLRLFTTIICVNKKGMVDLVNIGVEKSKLRCIPAYIHPDNDENVFSKKLKKVEEFIKDSESFVICANGSINFRNNVEVYGFDMMIEMMINLRNKYEINNVKLIIALIKRNNTQSNKIYLASLYCKIEKYNLKDKIMIYEPESLEFFPIIKECKLYIRPNSTDGFALSVAESLFGDTPVIASDVCKRPQGTILIKNRDQNDLEQKIKDVMENYSLYKKEAKETRVQDFSKRLYNLYRHRR